MMKRIAFWFLAGSSVLLPFATGCAHDVVMGEYVGPDGTGGTSLGEPTPVDDSDDNVPPAGSGDDHADDDEHDDDDASPGSGGMSQP
jgi:hypothetical protein